MSRVTEWQEKNHLIPDYKGLIRCVSFVQVEKINKSLNSHIRGSVKLLWNNNTKTIKFS